MNSLSVQHLGKAYWHLAAHRSELARPKDYLRFSWALGELAVYNDHGETIAFDNICPHRGARFFVDDAGNALASCPYHGWTYRNGALRIPPLYQACVADCEPPRLNAYQTAWCGDFLFVSPRPDHSLEDQLGDLAPRLAGISADIMGRSDLNAYDFECGWRVAVENALEADHVALIHPGSLGALKLGPGRFEYAGLNSSWMTEVTDARTVKGLNLIGRYFDIRHAHRGYTNIFLFPFAMLSSTFGYSYSLQLFLPGQDPHRTHFSSRLLRCRTKAPEGHAAVESLIASTTRLNRQIFEEDHQICRRISPAYDMNRPDRFFGDSEGRLRHFATTLERLCA